jgi:hypothetical protein
MVNEESLEFAPHSPKVRGCTTLCAGGHVIRAHLYQSIVEGQGADNCLVAFAALLEFLHI